MIPPIETPATGRACPLHKLAVMKALLLENIHDEAVRTLKKAGYEVERVSEALDEDDLISALEELTCWASDHVPALLVGSLRPAATSSMRLALFVLALIRWILMR